MTGNTDLEVKFAQKQREMLKKFCVSLKISWEPGSLVPGEYPTLASSMLLYRAWETQMKMDSMVVGMYPGRFL